MKRIISDYTRVLLLFLKDLTNFYKVLGQMGHDCDNEFGYLLVFFKEDLCFALMLAVGMTLWGKLQQFRQLSRLQEFLQ